MWRGYVQKSCFAWSGWHPDHENIRHSGTLCTSIEAQKIEKWDVLRVCPRYSRHLSPLEGSLRCFGGMPNWASSGMAAITKDSTVSALMVGESAWELGKGGYAVRSGYATAEIGCL